MMQSVKSLAAQSELQASPLKLTLFGGISILLRQCNVHWLCYCCMLLVECLQLLYYCLHNRYGFLWQCQLTDGLQFVLKFLDSSGWLHQFPTLLLPFSGMSKSKINPALFFMVVFLLAVVRQGYMVARNSRRIFGSIDRYIVKTLNVMAVLLKTVLYIPFLYVLMTLLTSNPAASYYAVNISIGAVGILLFASIQVTLNWFFFCNLSFHSHSISSFSQYADAAKNIVKTIPPLFLAIDTKGVASREFMIGMCLVYLVWCVLTLKLFQPYRAKERAIAGVAPAVCLWVCLSVVYQSYNSREISGLFYTLLALPIVVVAWLSLLHQRRRNYGLVKVDELASEKDMVRYTLEFIRNLQEQDSPECRMWLKSAFEEHHEACRSALCCCQKMMTCFTNRLEITGTDWFELLKDLVDAKLQTTFNNSCGLNLLLSHIYLCRMNNKYRSIYHINRIDDCSPGLPMQLQSYFFRGYIQHTIDHENRTIRDSRCIDLQNLYDFHQGFSAFRESIVKVCERHIEFWKELEEVHPEGIKLYQLCEEINLKLARLKRQFLRLEAMNPNSMHLLTQYGEFLAAVRGSPDALIKNKAHDLKRLTLKKSQLGQQHHRPDTHYSESTDTGIVVVSANENDLGVVQYLNCSASQKLGFTQKQLVGKSLNALVPQCLHGFHDQRMRSYVGRSSHPVDVEAKAVYMIDSKGHVIYMSMILETLPDISDGVAIIGFFYELPLNGRYLICDENSEVKAVSQSFSSHFGVPTNFRCNLNTSIMDFQLVDLAEGAAALKKKMLVMVENNNISVKRFEESEWQVSISLKERKVISEKSCLYLLVFLDHEADEKNDSHTYHSSVAKQQSIKEGSDLDEQEKQVESSQKLYNEAQVIIDSEEQPIRMRWLSRLGYLSLFLIAVLCSIALPLFYTRVDKIQQYANAISINYDLMMSLTDTIASARGIQRMVRLNTLSAVNLSSYNEAVSKANDAFVRYEQSWRNISAFKYTADPIVTYWTVTTGAAFKPSKVPLSAAIVQYQTACSGVQTTSVSDFNFTFVLEYLTSPLTNNQQSLITMRYNTLYSIIPAVANVVPIVQQVYTCWVLNCNYSGAIILAIGLALICALATISLYSHLKVTRIGLEVLGLLGFLESTHVHSNIRDIKRYQECYLSDVEIGHSLDSEQSSEAESTPAGQTLEKLEKLPTSVKTRDLTTEHIRISINANLETVDGKDTRRSCLPSDSEQRTSPSDISKRRSKKKLNEERTKGVRERQLELMSTRLADSWRIVLKYLLFAIVLLSYFVSDYLLVNQNLSQLLQSNREYQMVSWRSSYSNIIRYYTEECIYDVAPFQGLPPLITPLSAFIQSMYEWDRNIQGFPQKDGFEQQIKLLDGKSVCSYFDLWNQYDQNAILSVAECNAIHNQVLTTGLRGVFVTLADLSRSSFLKSNLTDQASMLFLIQQTEFNQILRLSSYIRAVSAYELAYYNKFISASIEQHKAFFVGKLAGFLVVLLLLTVWAWRSMMAQMQHMINNIKGLVLIISFRKIQLLPSLKEEMVKSRVLHWFA